MRKTTPRELRVVLSLLGKKSNVGDHVLQSQLDQMRRGGRIEWPTFLTLVARTLGNDTLFVLAYSTIQLNTDAHNPQLEKRMSRREFSDNKRKRSNLQLLVMCDVWLHV